MTLLELLVKELPKRGGWPDGAHGVVQDKSGRIWFYKNGKPYFTGVVWGADPVSHDFDWIDWDLWLERSDDHATSIITREQYEAAIVAQQPVWNGDGLPPVGFECEVAASTPYLKIGHPEGTVVKIYAHFTDDRGVELAAFVDAAGKVGGVCTSNCFRPIRTESDLKREDACKQIYAAMDIASGDMAESIYDAISAGKIPGVELSK